MPTESYNRMLSYRLNTKKYINAAPVAPQSDLIISQQVTDTITKEGPLRGWRRLIRERRSATTPLSGTKYYVSGSPNGGTILYQRSRVVAGVKEVVGSESTGLVAGTPSMAVFGSVSLSQTRANNQALNQIVSDIASAKREVQSLVCAGELGETLRFVRQKSQTLHNGFWSYLDELKKRSRGIRRGRFVREMIAEAWLERQFVIVPLVKDIQAAARAAARIAINHQPSVRVFGRGYDDRTLALTGHTVQVLNHWTLRKAAYQHQIIKVRYSGSVSAPKVSAYGNMEVLGITPGEVLGSVWELIPWSFVVDYFTNVQEVLESLRFHSTDLDWCEKGTFTSQVASCSDVGLTPASVGGWTLDWARVDPGTKLKLKKVSVTRANYLGNFTPSLEFEIPGLSLKWLNLLALNQARRQVSRRLRTLG